MKAPYCHNIERSSETSKLRKILAKEELLVSLKGMIAAEEEMLETLMDGSRQPTSKATFKTLTQTLYSMPAVDEMISQ